MKAERFRQIRNLFDAALEREPASRHTFLQEACLGDEELLMEVGRLLAAHGEPTQWIDDSVLGKAPARLEGRRLGPYTVLRQLGEGGMGSVFLAAEGEGAERTLVAIKIVRAESSSGELLRRFQRERDILESLDHPNIARIRGGGTTADGLPFIVMDYVDGQPIDAYCDDHRLHLADRLKLFRDVCAAVQYAHEHHVVHRDIKPANILVTSSGTVKLLDFGIARLVGPASDALTILTRTDLLLMTPEYASPEQVSGLAATPASDIYALGVVLYQILTGHRPYRLKSRILSEIVRVICEERPTRPSLAVTEKDSDQGAPSLETLSRARALSPTEWRQQLTGDLDCILLRALEKHPAERYRSARDFSEDLDLHLRGLTVEARRQAFLRSSGRFISQNRWWLLGAGAAGAAVLSGLVEVPNWVLLEIPVIAMALGVGYLWLRRAAGESDARRSTGMIGKLVTVTMVGFTAFIMGTPHRLAAGIMVIYMVVLSALCWFLLFRWRGRADKLGPLVLDLSRGADSTLRIVLPAVAIVAILIVGGAASLNAQPNTLLPVTASLVFISASVFLSTLAERFEIRQRGLAIGPALISWSRVTAYSWAPDPNKREMLSVRCRGLWGISPKISMEPVHRSTVQEILERQLGEWPTSTPAPSASGLTDA